MIKKNKSLIASFLLLLITLSFSSTAQVASEIVNDISQLNPIKVKSVIKPRLTSDIVEAVVNNPGPISIGGGRYSMGGQTATENAIQIDMRNFDSIISFDLKAKEITVQAGVTWRKVIEFIDPYDLSIQIMQTYAAFTVGGSLSVNVHGRYIGQGPIILSVKEIKIVLANGNCVLASPIQNKEIFYGAIGGYGGLGVITEVTLFLTNNCKLERSDKLISIKKYNQFFNDSIRNDTTVVFHNADIYPSRYKQTRAITYRKTSRNVTINERLRPLNINYKFNKSVFKFISNFKTGKWMRQHLIDPILNKGNPVEWRNYEASYDILELEPTSRIKSTYILQEYFVPVSQFDQFLPKMTQILRENKVNCINISIRHAKKDPGSLLAWAQTEVFAFVIYYKQGTSQKNKDKVKDWTQKMIDAAISCNGTYYLPYQILATKTQFLKAYPNVANFIQLKKRLDPTNKFRNKLWDSYF